MADYFTQCSVLLPYESDGEFVWLENELRAASGDVCTVCKEDEYNCTCLAYSGADELAGFVFEDQTPATESQGRRAFWIHDDEGQINGDILIDIVARFQRAFAKDDFWECTFAETCSKPRLDAYSGWGVLIHHGQAYYCFPSDQATARVAQLTRQDTFAQTLPIHL